MKAPLTLLAIAIVCAVLSVINLSSCIGYPKATQGKPKFEIGEKVEYNGTSSLGQAYEPPLTVKAYVWDYDYSQYSYTTTDNSGRTWPAFLQYQLKKY